MQAGFACMNNLTVIQASQVPKEISLRTPFTNHASGTLQIFAAIS
jgi:hypothetical protein